METFDCPKCGAPVSYEPNVFRSTGLKCGYCQSQLAVPHLGQPAHVISQIDLNVSPHIVAGAKKAAWVMVLIPVVIVVMIVGGVLIGVFSALRSTSQVVSAVRFRGRRWAVGFKDWR